MVENPLFVCALIASILNDLGKVKMSALGNMGVLVSVWVVAHHTAQ